MPYKLGSQCIFIKRSVRGKLRLIGSRIIVVKVENSRVIETKVKIGSSKIISVTVKSMTEKVTPRVVESDPGSLRPPCRRNHFNQKLSHRVLNSR